MKMGCPRGIIAPSRIRAASARPSSCIHPLDDRVAADLLLAVEGEADVDRQLAGRRELPDGLDEHEEVPLVVGHTTRVQPSVALRQLEGRRLPELERVGRLDVEVRVAEDRRRGLGRSDAAELADHERSRAPRDEVAEPPPSRMRPATHAAAASMSAACAASALTEGMAMSSASVSRNESDGTVTAASLVSVEDRERSTTSMHAAR